MWIGAGIELAGNGNESKNGNINGNGNRNEEQTKVQGNLTVEYWYR